MSLKDLTGSIQNLFNQAPQALGNAVNFVANPVGSVSNALFNQVQRIPQVQQIENAFNNNVSKPVINIAHTVIPSLALDNILKSVSNYQIPSSTIPFVGGAVQNLQNTFHQSPTFTPRDIYNIAAPVVQAPFRAAASIKATPVLQNAFPGMNYPQTYQPQGIEKLLLGDQPINSINQRISTGYNVPVVGKVNGLAAAPFVVAGTLLDLLPFSGAEKNAASEGIQLAKRSNTLEDFASALKGSSQEVQTAVSKVIEDSKTPINTLSDFYNVVKRESALRPATRPGSYTNVASIDNRLINTPEALPFVNDIKNLPSTIETSFSNSVKKAKAITEPAQVNPIEFKNLFDKWIGERDVAKTTGTQVAARYKSIPASDGMDIINFIENPNLKVSPQVQKAAQDIKGAFDSLYKEANDSGVDVNYLRNYITHIYEDSPQKVEEAFRSAGQSFKFAQDRKIPTYAQAIELGLHPLYTNPQEILQSYVTKLWQTKANIDFISSLKQRGLIIEGKTSGFIPITAPGISEGMYAPPQIARAINRIFSPEDTGVIGTAMDIGRKVSGKIQDVTLSGGIPNTPANAFTFAQINKEILAGRVKSPVMSFVNSLSSDKAVKFFEENAGQIKKLQSHNVAIHSTFDVANMIDKPTTEKLFGKTIGEAWDKVVNEPTFGKFMPMLQINLFNDIEKQALSAGRTAQEAEEVAAKAVKNFYGVANSGTEAMRAKLTKDTVGTLFFAPKYRESMVNFWVNTIKSMKDPLALENKTNFKFAIGAILTYLGMDQANRALNGGHGMQDNPEGKKDKLLIPLKDGYTIGIPFLSSIATVPRNLLDLGSSIVHGNFPEALNASKSFLSQAVRPPLDLLTNENYYGQQIYTPGSPSQLKDMGLYLAGAYNHPYIKAAIQATQGKMPAYQIASQALELPLRYYSSKSIASSDYFAAIDKSANSLGVNDKQIFLGIIHPQTKDAQGNSIVDKNVYTSPTKYEVLLSNPKVLQAELAFQHSQPHHDPLWDLSPAQLKAYMQAQVISKNDPGGDKKTVAALYNQVPQEFFTKRQAYFDNLQSQGVDLGSGSTPQAPQTPPEIQAFWDNYFSLPAGTGARSQALKTPLGQQALALSQQKLEFTNKQRVAMGLPELPGSSYTAYARKPRKISIKSTKISAGKPLVFKAAKKPTIKIAKNTFKLTKTKKATSKPFRVAPVRTKFSHHPSLA